MKENNKNEVKANIKGGLIRLFVVFSIILACISIATGLSVFISILK